MEEKKWEDLGNDEWVFENEFGLLRVDNGEDYHFDEEDEGKFRAYWDWEDSLELGWFDTIEEAKAACTVDYKRRVTEIAAANGYIKLHPGYVAVDADELRRIENISQDVYLMLRNALLRDSRVEKEAHTCLSCNHYRKIGKSDCSIDASIPMTAPCPEWQSKRGLANDM